MRPKYLILVMVFVCTSWIPSVADAVDVGGAWDSNVMGAKIRAFVEQHGDQLSGVAKVQMPGGKKSTYHFSGSINGTQIQVAHHKGHSFSGTLTTPRQMVGVLKTRGGQRLSVTATRR